MAENTVNTFLNIESIDLEYAGLKKGSLKGEVAVVTGGANNIGLGYSRALAWAGASVVVADINEKAGIETARVINEENSADVALFVNCDVTEEKNIKNLAAKAFEKFGKVDILLNNAMNVGLKGSVLNSKLSDLEQSYQLSGRAVMCAILEFVPKMVERKHGVVAFSSSQFHYAPPLVGGAIYCAGKAIGSSITMSLANELKDTGVYVFCLTPAGVVRQDATRQARDADGNVLKPDGPARGMPGFNGTIPPEAGGAAMVYSILNASTLHGSGISISEAFSAMNYPFPNPATLRAGTPKKLNDMELTLVLMNMGPGFTGFAE